MHIENFKIFTDLVESQSFSRAAKINGITQSAVSQQMRAMEKHFNVLIVDRAQKHFRLTPEGQKIYEAARQFIQMSEQLSSELQEMRKTVSGEIHISTIYSIGLHELPAYVKEFLKEFPAVNIRVEYRRSNMVYEDVLHNAVDMGLVAFPIKHRQLEIIPFHEDQLIIICSPKHALASRKEVGIEELSQYEFIGFDQDIPTRKATDQIFKDNKIDIKPVREFDNIETVKRAVEIDAGIALVPEATVLPELKQKHLCRLHIKGRKLVRPLAIIHRKGRVLTPALKQFVTLLTTKDLVPVMLENGAAH
ncbi:MAG TPA: LysR family transcriptional regulator [Opitutales bacterium]|nr:LysR family transcriptional regulator [Opitutales bacterium]